MDNQRKKRQKYKSYVLLGSETSIPPRTERRWRRRKICMRNPVRGETSKQINDTIPDEQSARRSYEKNVETAENSPMQKAPENEIVPEFQPFNNIISHQAEVSEDSTTNDKVENETNATGAMDLDDSILESSLVQYSMDVLIRTLLVMATKIHSNLTYTDAENLLHLADVLGDLNITHRSKYHWKKILNHFSNFMSIHHFCDKCHYYVGKEDEEDTELVQRLTCTNCNHAISINRNWESGYIMLYMNLKDQLQHFLHLHHDKLVSPQTRLKENEYAIEDIYDGKIYRKIVGEGMITLNFNIDGTPISDSSPVSVYPVLCTLNELDPKERGKNIMLNNLWLGKGKPKSMNEFFKPFVAEMQDLYSSGFTYEYKGTEYFRKSQLLICVCDTIARPLVRCSTQFNGNYGCGLCLHPGLQVPKGNGSVRVYPIDEAGNPFGEGLRDHNETLLHAVDKKKGIKDRSILTHIPNFNIIDNLVVDWMHSTALGVAKQFGKLWFDSTSHNEEFYLGAHQSLINLRLEAFTPSLDISRTPRKISERQYWKAHEWAIWLLFYSLGVIDDVLPRKYVQHWALLVDGIAILLKKSIMPSEIEYARTCLYNFVRDVAVLYGIENVSFNVHLLTHLPDSVLKWGPLWTHSAFIYENFNQILKNTVHSSNAVPLQVCDTFRHKCALSRLQSMCEGSMTHSQKNYLSKMMNSYISPRVLQIVDGVGILGTLEMDVSLPRAHYLALKRLEVPVDNYQSIQTANRILLRKEIIHSKDYSRPVKRKSYIVLVDNSEIFEIENFVVINMKNSSTCYAIGKYYEKTRSVLFHHRRLPHMTFLKGIIDNLAAINVHNIKEKVTLIHTAKFQQLIACAHPNKFEFLN